MWCWPHVGSEPGGSDPGTGGFIDERLAVSTQLALEANRGALRKPGVLACAVGIVIVLATGHNGSRLWANVSGSVGGQEQQQQVDDLKRQLQEQQRQIDQLQQQRNSQVPSIVVQPVAPSTVLLEDPSKDAKDIAADRRKQQEAERSLDVQHRVSDLEGQITNRYPTPYVPVRSPPLRHTTASREQ